MSTLLKHVEKLESLRALATSEGFRDAAKLLGIAPSTLSERIDTLERLFRRPLVERGRGRPTLTPFARELVEAAEPALAVLEGLLPEAAGERRAPRVLRVGAYESLALRSLTQALFADRAALPGTLELVSGRAVTLVRALVAGELDVVAVAGPLEDERVEAFQVGTEELVLVRPRRVDEAVARAAVAEGRWVGLTRASLSRRGYYARLLAAIGAGRPRFSCDSFEVAARVCLEGDLPGVLPSRVAKDLARELCVVEIGELARQEGRHPIVLAVKRGLLGRHHVALRTALERALAKSA
ncbi:MAG: LysR family transcriptional regulator [Myxococcales bacterium]|nr:LysR family transcriptional regulator [Myxococcales bacterium]